MCAREGIREAPRKKQHPAHKTGRGGGRHASQNASVVQHRGHCTEAGVRCCDIGRAASQRPHRHDEVLGSGEARVEPQGLAVPLRDVPEDVVHTLSPQLLLDLGIQHSTAQHSTAQHTGTQHSTQYTWCTTIEHMQGKHETNRGWGNARSARSNRKSSRPVHDENKGGGGMEVWRCWGGVRMEACERTAPPTWSPVFSCSKKMWKPCRENLGWRFNAPQGRPHARGTGRARGGVTQRKTLSAQLELPPPNYTIELCF